MLYNSPLFPHASQFLAFAAAALEEDLGLTETQYGLIITATFISNTLFMYPSAIVAKRITLRVYLCVTFLVQGIILACTVFVNDFTAIVVVRCLLGALMAGVTPGLMAYVADFYGKEAFGTAWARSYNVGLPTGTLVGGPIAAAILHAGRHGQLASWKWVFVAEALVVFAVVVPSSLLLPSNPSSCRSFLSAVEQDWLLKKTDASQEQKREVSEDLANAEGETGVLKSLLTDHRILILCATRLCRVVGIMGLLFFAPLILEDEGLSESSAALWLSLMMIVAIAVAQFWAMHSDRTGERIIHSIVGHATLSVGLFAAAFSFGVSLPVSVISIGFARVGVEMAYIPFQAFIADILPRNASNAGMAILGMAASAGGIIAPVVIGALRATYGGFAIPLFFLAGSTLLATVCLIPLGVSHRRNVLMDELELV